jgi:threonine/homoserine/homoserine lactone efflux protein
MMLQFALAVLVLMLLPGPDMAYVIANGMAYGVRGALYSALGIGTGGLLLTALVAAVLVAASAIDMKVLAYIQVAGSLYLLYVAARTIIPRAGSASGLPRPSVSNLFVRGLVTNVSNPKAIVFFLAFIPQFIPRDTPAPAAVAIVLGLTLCLMGTAINLFFGISGVFVGRYGSMVVSGRTITQWVVFFVLSAIGLSFLVIRFVALK